MPLRGGSGLEGDLGALGLQLGPGLLGALLVGLLQDRLRRGLDKVLGLLQAQAGQLAYDLDDLDLLAAVRLQDHVELALLLDLLGGRGSGGGHHHRGRGGRLDVERLLELLDELGELDERHLLERVQQLGSAQLRHGGWLSFRYSVGAAAASASTVGAGAAAVSAWPPPSFSRFSCRAATRRTAWVNGAWNVAAALLRLAFIAPASFARTTSRDSRSASLRTSSADIVRPSNTPPLMMSSGFVFANSRRPLAASTGSPATKASAVGPVNKSSRPVMPASVAARLARVFLVTVYVVPRPSERRSCLSWATVSPRYSVSSVAEETRKLSVSSATAVALSARTGLSAMSLLSLQSAGSYQAATTRNR